MKEVMTIKVLINDNLDTKITAIGKENNPLHLFLAHMHVLDTALTEMIRLSNEELDSNYFNDSYKKLMRHCDDLLETLDKIKRL